MLLSGGTLELLGSSTFSGATLEPGAVLEIGPGYTLSSYELSIGTTFVVLSSATAAGTTVSSGTELVFGTAVSTVLDFAGKQVVEAGGTAIGTAISQGVGSSRVDLQACKLEYSIVSPK